MALQRTQIQRLLSAVEQYHSRPIRTTVDFEALSITIEQQTSERLSASTLKRLWGYVNDTHIPRHYTLDVLSKYIGHDCFEEFCKHLELTEDETSDFITPMKIITTELSIGDRVEVGWSPNRYIIIECIDNNRFRVVHSENSKIEIADEFSLMTLMLNYPLYIPNIKRGDTLLPSFVAGKNGGLSLLGKL